MAESHTASHRKLSTLACMGVFAATSGCALQADYAPPAMEMPKQWSQAQGATRTTGTDRPFPDRWWTALHDSGINALVLAALEDSPTVDEAVARSDEARAVLRGAGAQRLPSIQASGGATRQRGAAAEAGETALSSVANASLGLGYEVDLFGRVRESVRAAEHRLAARSAEVQGARLTIVAQIADGVVTLRACEFSRRVRALDIESRMQVLELTRRRVAVGVDARVEESRAMNSLASARTEAAVLNQECERQAYALYVLTGIEGVEVRSIVLGAGDESARPFMPTSPELPLPLSATVLADHPDLVAANRDAAAAWSDIGVARAARLPRIDLGAMLTGNWLRAAGSTVDFTTWSFGPTLAAPLLDGGAGASNVDAAEARYRAAEARLRLALRRVVQEVEQALASEASSRTRMSSAQEALAAARDTFLVTERRWRAGATSLFELEDSRRQRSAAEDAAIAATRDHVQAWIALIKAIGVVTPPIQDSE